jgi:hypothetical protein
MKWRSMDEIKATALTTSTQYPHMVCPLPLSALPLGIQNMPGLTAAYISSYVSTQPAAGGVSAQGEFAAVRFDAGTGKGYNYVFGVSSNNMSYFSGPRTDIPGHHFDPTHAVPISSLFLGNPKGSSR